MGKSETEISRQIAEYLDKRGFFNLRLNAGKVKVKGGWLTGVKEGCPDRFFLLPKELTEGFASVAVFIEVKTATGKLSPVQIEMHKTISKKGGFVIVATSLTEAISAITTLEKIK